MATARSTKLSTKEREAINHAIGVGVAQFGDYLQWREGGRLLVEDRLVNVATAAGNAVLAAKALAAGAQNAYATGIVQPGHPRVLSITGGASGQNGIVTIRGKDVDGNTITDAITSNGTAVVQGTKAFKKVTSIDLPAFTNDTSDTIAVGTTTKLGFTRKLEHNTVMFTFVDDALEGTPPTVTASKTAVSGNFFVPNTVPNNTRDYVIYYMTTAPVVSTL